MTATTRIMIALTVAMLVGVPTAAAAQDERGPRDMWYTSPTWGYHVRWYSDEWTIDEETSEDGVDSIWLSDAIGNIVGFDAGSAYGGDATVCLDDLIAGIDEIPGATDVEIVFDEEGTEQRSYDPWWSWAILLVRLPAGEQPVDHVVYLDCRTLAPGNAVLTRTLAAPAATFEASMDRFAILQASLPRSAWLVDPEYGYLMVGESPTLNWSLFFDQVCGGFPRDGRVLFAPDGSERALLSVVDGPGDIWRIDTIADTMRVLLIENTSGAPLTIDPRGFVYIESWSESGVPLDLASPRVVWEDTGETGVRQLAPGTLATVQLTWPEDLLFPEEGVTLVYRDVELGVEADVDSVGVAGGCGGGSRPRLRISR